MEVDRARASTSGRVRPCFRCGEVGHFANQCTKPLDVRAIDLLQEIALQLGPELSQEFAALALNTRDVAQHAAETETSEQDPEDFPSRGE